MKYLSVCSGIEAATVAWHGFGWQPWAFSEIEPFPSAVLAHNYPAVPNLGDMTAFRSWPDATIDLLVGGTPCQSFSVAGLRKGLGDPRGNLMLTYGAIAQRYRPRWLVWENVPGVLSSNAGRDFGTFLGMLGELGYGFAYRVLDAQFFGVAQRRRRVFVVGHLGDWRPAAAVLFERHSLQGHPAPSREAREDAAAGALRSTDGGSDVDHARAQHLISMAHGQGGAEIGFDRGPTLTCNHEAPIVAGALPVAFAQNSRDELRLEGGDGSRTGALTSGGGKPGQGVPMIAFPANLSSTQHASAEDLAPAMGAKNPTAVAYAIQAGALRSNPDAGPDGVGVQADHAYTLEARAEVQCVQTAMQVRRLTPLECERLQGFPDGYTAIPWRKKAASECPDGPRYKALGNSMAVPVMRWIGARINLVEAL